MVTHKKRANPNTNNDNPTTPSKLNNGKPISTVEKAEHSTIKFNDTKEPYWQKFIRKWLIVLFTGVMTYYTASLFKLTTTQANDASIKADSAFALSKRIFLNQVKFAEIETRAYISIVSVNANPPYPDSIKFGVAVFMNIGKTPAHNCRHFIRTIIKNREISRDEIEKVIIEPKTGATLGTNIPERIFTKREYRFTKSDCDSINKGLLKLYVVGKIFYDDTFGIHRFSNFCGLYDPNSMGTIRINIFSDAN